MADNLSTYRQTYVQHCTTGACRLICRHTLSRTFTSHNRYHPSQSPRSAQPTFKPLVQQCFLIPLASFLTMGTVYPVWTNPEQHNNNTTVCWVIMLNLCRRTFQELCVTSHLTIPRKFSVSSNACNMTSTGQEHNVSHARFSVQTFCFLKEMYQTVPQNTSHTWQMTSIWTR
jgi:hypothetical protein